MNGDSSAAHYRKHACDYDASAARTMALRRRAIARLALQSGDVVVDAGCGTGLSFALLLEAVGRDGQVIGVESSPQMMALARQRVAQEGWPNVLLIEDAIERARWPVLADALLFNYTHDIVRAPAALAAIFRQSRPGARVAAAGIKHPPPASSTHRAGLILCAFTDDTSPGAVTPVLRASMHLGIYWCATFPVCRLRPRCSEPAISPGEDCPAWNKRPLPFVVRGAV